MACLAPAATAAAPMVLQAAASGQEFLQSGIPSCTGNGAQAQQLLSGIGCRFVSAQQSAYGLLNVVPPPVPFLVGSYANRLTSDPQHQHLMLENGSLSLRQKATVKGKLLSQAELLKRLPSWFVVEESMDRMLLDMAQQQSLQLTTLLMSASSEASSAIWPSNF
eukprot:jgi/Chrzof1/14809/Cz09g17050.t1